MCIRDRAYIRNPDVEMFLRLQEAAHGLVRLITIAPETDGAKAVSYTHLDVYKRQALARFFASLSSASAVRKPTAFDTTMPSTTISTASVEP